jgi:hypothetical protein
MVFPSKQEAQYEAQRLLRQAKQSGSLGQSITPGDAEFEFLWHLWHHHPTAHEHAHERISYFSIAENTDGPWLWPSYCFWIHFADGQFRDLSYKKCLDNLQHKQTTAQGGWTGPSAPRTAAELDKANQEAQLFALILEKQQEQHAWLLPQAWRDQALRRAIIDQVVQYKIKAFNASAPFKCPITGDVVSEIWDCHLDHYDPPFSVLADQWLSQQGLAMVDDAGWMAAWNDQAQLSWQQYHRDNANLRLVSKAGNFKTVQLAKDARAAARIKFAEPIAHVPPQAAAQSAAIHASSGTSAPAATVVEPSTPKKRRGRPRKVVQEQQGATGSSSSTTVQGAAAAPSVGGNRCLCGTSAASPTGGTTEQAIVLKRWRGRPPKAS